MGNAITLEHAEKIAKKLNGQRFEGKKASGGAREHIDIVISHEGREIAAFGIRRGSKKALPHGHVPKDLHIGPHDCKSIATCQVDYDGYIALLRANGTIPEA
jgi:hypothetical protein